MPILDLGCGKAKRQAAIGVDLFALPHVDVLCDLNGTLPFAENSVDGVYASHVIEHVEDFLGLMQEIWRVSKPGAWVRIWTPHFSSGPYAWGDPTHRRAFASNTFDYLGDNQFHYIRCSFRAKSLRLNLFAGGSPPSASRLKHRIIIRVGGWIEHLVNRSRESQLRFERVWCYFFPFTEIFVELQVVKSK